MNNKLTEIARLMHDICLVYDDSTQSRHIPFGKFKLILETASAHRFASSDLKIYSSLRLWSTAAMFISTTRKSEFMGTITHNMIYSNTALKSKCRAFRSAFVDDADDYTIIDVPPELDGSDRESYLFQQSVLDDYEEFAVMVQAYDISCSIDNGEYAMYNSLIALNPEEMDELINFLNGVKNEYTRTE